MASRAAVEGVHVLTNRYDNRRSAVNTREKVLRPDRVSVEQFGKLFTRTVDGDLYAQPLIVSGLHGFKGRGQQRNVVYLASSRNWVYAYDADDPDESIPLWQQNLGPSVPRHAIPPETEGGLYTNFGSEVGVTSTPVIDYGAADRPGALYVVAKTWDREAAVEADRLARGLKQSRKEAGQPDDAESIARLPQVRQAEAKAYFYHLHALNLHTGKPLVDAVQIKVLDRALDAKGIFFGARRQLNRPGLLLQKGVLYLAFGSHGDVEPFWGWVMAYDARTLRQRAVYCTAPSGWGEGGIWQSGCGLAGDEEGNVYAVVGNGSKPTSFARENGGEKPPEKVKKPVYGNSILKLRLATKRRSGFKVVDWFTASDCFDLNEFDNDLCAGPVLFEAVLKPRPASAPGGHHGAGPAEPQGEETLLGLVLAGGKDGRFYLADRNDLGNWKPVLRGDPPHPVPPSETLTNEGSEDKPDYQWNKKKEKYQPDNPIRQSDPLCEFHIHCAPAVWTRSQTDVTAFVWSEKDFLKALKYDANEGVFRKVPDTTSTYGFPPHQIRMPGGMVSVSSDGGDGGIVWASHPTDDDAMNKTVRGTLRAFDALDLDRELWTSDQDAEAADRVGSFAKFCPPVVANGKVYLATFSRELVVYGNLTRRSPESGIWSLRGIGSTVQGSLLTSCARFDLRSSGVGFGIPTPDPAGGPDAAKGTADGFFFAYREIDTLTEPDITLTAKLTGLRSPHSPAASAGVMIRQKIDPRPEAAIHAAVVVTSDRRVLFLRRDRASGPTLQEGPLDIPIPVWIRLCCTRVSTEGNRGRFKMSAFVSPDGSNWSRQVGASDELTLEGTVWAGLVASAQSSAASDYVEASFYQVELAPWC
jgi:hypothetical protein